MSPIPGAGASSCRLDSCANHQTRSKEPMPWCSRCQFIDNGGNVLIMLGEGGEAKFGTNINFLLEEYGIMINSDAVCR